MSHAICYVPDYYTLLTHIYLITGINVFGSGMSLVFRDIVDPRLGCCQDSFKKAMGSSRNGQPSSSGAEQGRGSPVENRRNAIRDLKAHSFVAFYIIFCIIVPVNLTLCNIFFPFL